jgi:hypothetical protein
MNIRYLAGVELWLYNIKYLSYSVTILMVEETEYLGRAQTHYKRMKM